MGVKEFREINWLLTKNNAYVQIFFNFFNNMSPAYTYELYQPSTTATTREGQIADYNYHTGIPVMVIKLFPSQAQCYGIIYLPE